VAGDSEKIGLLLDSLGVTMQLREGDMVTDAVVIAKIVGGDGTVAVGMGLSESSSWLDQLGLIAAAADLVRNSGPEFMNTEE
jgi:hypothetical protein